MEAIQPSIRLRPLEVEAVEVLTTVLDVQVVLVVGVLSHLVSVMVVMVEAELLAKEIRDKSFL
jgi:hypothetical protein